MEDAIGWVSSGILVLTVGNQVYKQWKSKTSQGVSRWLFVGQLAASIGFVIYSWMLESWVFVATNSLMVANALAGATIVYLQRRRGAPRSAERRGQGPAGVQVSARRRPAGAASERRSPLTGVRCPVSHEWNSKQTNTTPCDTRASLRTGARETRQSSLNRSSMQK